MAISFAARGASKREFIAGDPKGERWRILKIYCLHQLYHVKSNSFFPIFFPSCMRYLCEIFFSFFIFRFYPRASARRIFTIIIHSSSIHQCQEALSEIAYAHRVFMSSVSEWRMYIKPHRKTYNYVIRWQYSTIPLYRQNGAHTNGFIT